MAGNGCYRVLQLDPVVTEAAVLLEGHANAAQLGAIQIVAYTVTVLYCTSMKDSAMTRWSK
jgi:hypothetical protein